MLIVKGTERLILRAVFQSDRGLHLFTLHTKFKVPPGILVAVIKNLSNKGLVTTDGERVALTKAGREFGHKARYTLFGSEGDKTWRQVPEKYKSPQLKIDTPYVPELRRLHWSLLPRKVKRKDANVKSWE